MSDCDMDPQPERAHIAEAGRAAPHLNIAADLRLLAFPVNELRPAPDNARRHAGADLDALAESLRQHCQQKPVVVKRQYRGVVNAVIAGSGALLAARRLNWTHLAVSWFEGSDDEALAFAIRDNRTAELSSWDASQLTALQADGLDLLALWHDDVGLADLLRADAPVPHYVPVGSESQHRLDELQPHCKTCTCRREAKL